jgi:hypothetical protein
MQTNHVQVINCLVVVMSNQAQEIDVRWNQAFGVPRSLNYFPLGHLHFPCVNEC